MDNKDNGKASLFHSPNVVNILTIIIVTLVCVVLVLVLAKGLFSSNSKDVPAGLDTGTIANGAASAGAQSVSSVSTSASAVTTTAAPAASVSGTGVSETTVSTAEVNDSVAYVVTYVQLKTQPDQDSANVICMSPNIKVNVLERRDDGYIKIAFHNFDGTDYTGYVKTEYLSPTPVERTTTTAAVTEATAGSLPVSGTTVTGAYSQVTTTSRSNNVLIETVGQTTPAAAVSTTVEQ